MAVDPQTIVHWLRRLLALDTRVFDDIRGNPSATIPAVILVAVATFFAGLGGWLWWMVRDYGQESEIFLHSAVVGSLLAIALWAGWLLIVYVILTQVFRERAYLEQLLRVMGLAASPMALMLLMFLPWVSFVIALVAVVLTFGLTNIAIQSATTADPAKVLLANLAGFALWALVLSLLVSSSQASVNANAPGIFLLKAPAEVLSDVDISFQPANEIAP